jgi:hypothetical protein
VFPVVHVTLGFLNQRGAASAHPSLPHPRQQPPANSVAAPAEVAGKAADDVAGAASDKAGQIKGCESTAGLSTGAKEALSASLHIERRSGA